MRKLAISSTLLAGCSGLLAQANPANGLLSPALNPPGFTAGAFGRSVVAELSNHQLPDVVVLATEAGGAGREAAVLVSAPGVHRSALLLPNTEGKQIRDVAVIRGGGTRAGDDALALATDQGLFRWRDGGVLTQLGGVNWLNATRIEVGDFDGDGFGDVVGRMGSASSGNPQNVRCTSTVGAPGWMFNTGGVILDLAVVDWVAQPGVARDEVAIVHRNAVHILVDGAIDPSLSVTLPTGVSARIVPMRTANGGIRLVVGMTDATGASVLATITPGNPTVAMRPVGLAIGGLTVVEEVGSSGVLVAIADNADLMHFVHDETTFPAEGFAPGNSVRSGAEPANGAADGRLLDLDADGDIDLLTTLVGTGIQISTTPGNDPFGGGRPVLIEDSDGLFTFQLPTWANCLETLHFQFTTMWEQSTVTSLSMSPVGLNRSFSPNGERFELITWPRIGSLSTGPVATLVRAVERDTQENVLRRGPFRTLIWSRQGPELTEATEIALATIEEGASAEQREHSTQEQLAYVGLAASTIIVYASLAEGIIPGIVEPPVLPPPEEVPPVPPTGGEGEEEPGGSGGSGG